MTFRVAVDVMPKDGILDPQGRAVERSLHHLGVADVRDVRVGRRVELSVDAATRDGALGVAEQLARELFANPLIERWSIELIGAKEAREPGEGGAAGATAGATAR